MRKFNANFTMTSLQPIFRFGGSSSRVSRVPKSFFKVRSSISQSRSYGECRCCILGDKDAHNLIASVSTGIIDIRTTPKEPVIEQYPTASFSYEKCYDSVLRRKKDDDSYRYFRNINRIAKEFPIAHSTDEKKRVNVWCSNDYVGDRLLHIKKWKTNDNISWAWVATPM